MLGLNEVDDVARVLNPAAITALQLGHSRGPGRGRQQARHQFGSGENVFEAVAQVAHAFLVAKVGAHLAREVAELPAKQSVCHEFSTLPE